MTCLLADCATSATHESESKELPILQNWRGDYPLSQLGRLPEGQRASPVGYLGDLVEFAEVWQAFKPGENVPEVDFSRHLAVFARNVDFYNRTAILKVVIRDGVAEIVAMETRSALPIEDEVAMAMAVIPRAGVKFIQAGDERILVTTSDYAAAADPLGETEQVLEGWVTIGHEVRSFVPCSPNVDHWLLGDSPALSKIMADYRLALPEARPYTPLFMILTGKFAESPRDGFGADYEAAFLAAQLVDAIPEGNCRSDYIVVKSPAPGEPITSPLTIRGRARGTWFFEGDFPILLKDLNGDVIARGFVTAQDNWMTEEFVPFTGTIEFEKPGVGDRGTLVFKKDNPSDRPELDDAMEIPVFFR